MDLGLWAPTKCLLLEYMSDYSLQLTTTSPAFLVEFGAHLFSFLSSCHLFVEDTIGCQSIS